MIAKVSLTQKRKLSSPSADYKSSSGLSCDSNVHRCSPWCHVSLTQKQSMYPSDGIFWSTK